MNRAFRLFLFVGALFGLFMQTATYAAAPVAPVMASQMDWHCMEMMDKQPPAGKPCKGLTLDCIAVMGCVAPVALPGMASPTAMPQFTLPMAFWPVSAVLIGSDLAPELHPPSILG